MSRLNELIRELCPDGVELKKLGVICEIKTGKGITKADAINGGHFPIISGGKYPMGYYNEWNRQANTVTISRVGAYAGFVSYIQEKFYLNDKCFSVIPLRQNIAPHFLFFVLKEFEEKIKVLQSEGGVPTINTKKVGNIEIPIPPLDVQNEIVRILDTFTSHTAELQAELQARKEQYEYYRNKLLTFDKDDKNVKWVKLGDACTINRGIRVVRNDLNKNGKYPVYQNSLTPLGYYDKSNYPKNTTFIISAGAAGEIGFSKEPMWAADDCLCIICTDNLLSKYVYHYLIEHKIFLISKIRKASIPRLSRVTIEKLPIAIPHISEQQRIISILDKFEILVNDLTAGIPAEIAAVQEQYEYYRNKLLTFKDVGTYHGASST